MTIINQPRSIIPACDVPLKHFSRLVAETHDLPGIGGYKIGPALTGRSGYDAVVATARKYTDKPLIYDGQKWGTDTPHIAEKILTPLKESGIDAVILFPLAGPLTQYVWTKASQDLDLDVIVGGRMTHSRFLSGTYSEPDKQYEEFFDEFDELSGYIKEEAPTIIYEIGARMGVTNFVMPGVYERMSAKFKKLIQDEGVEPTVFAPGFGTQGGDIAKFVETIGGSVHLIVGRAIYDAPDMREAAEKLTNLI